MENGFRYCSIQLSVPTEACLKSGKSYPSRRLILVPPHFRHLFLLQKATYLQGYWGYPGAWETLPAMLILACDAWYIFLINLSKLAYWGPFSQPCFVKRGQSVENFTQVLQVSFVQFFKIFSRFRIFVKTTSPFWKFKAIKCHFA